MVASKGNLQCEMCHLDGISTKSSLKRHQRFYCKGAVDVTPQQPLTTDVKVVAVSEEEVIMSTAEGAEESSSSYCVHCCHDFQRAFNADQHSCPLAPDLDPDIPVLRLLSRSDTEQFKLDHRGNTMAQVGEISYTICKTVFRSLVYLFIGSICNLGCKNLSLCKGGSTRPLPVSISWACHHRQVQLLGKTPVLLWSSGKRSIFWIAIRSPGGWTGLTI